MTDKIRNFCIIAHIDHGKSTLADRLLVLTNTISKEKIGEQYLDSNPISRERGITIKLAPVRMSFTLGADSYTLNLIDTPGHVDFSFEVIRTLYACEGAVLLVDATKGIQAQTVANYNFAKKLGLTIIPAVNKIDLPTARVDEIINDMVGTFGFARDEVLRISAKTGHGVEELIQEIIKRVPAPVVDRKLRLQGFVFDSVYDEHKGVVIYARVRAGSIKKGDDLIFLSDKTIAHVLEVGFMQPSFVHGEELSAGDVGYIITNIKDISLAKVGDTITHGNNPGEQLLGYAPSKSFVFLSIYPSSAAEFNDLRKALFTLKLNDASLDFISEHSDIFGPGFRCGFLGLLHAQIIIERIEREFKLDVFAAPPSIEYIVDRKHITNPKDFPAGAKEILEPYIKGEIYTPESYLGALIELIHERRGESSDINYFGSQVKVEFVMPLSSIMYDFYDRLKSVSQGYASFDYEIIDFRLSDLEKVDVSVNYTVIPELSFIVHKSQVDSFSRSIINKLQETIPKHQFVITVRAQIGSHIIASEKIGALHKNVLAKMSGGDYTRKSKLLEKQKKGKEKMKQIGNVSIPKEAFMSVLKV